MFMAASECPHDAPDYLRRHAGSVRDSVESSAPGVRRDLIRQPGKNPRAGARDIADLRAAVALAVFLDRPCASRRPAAVNRAAAEAAARTLPRPTLSCLGVSDAAK